MSLNLDDLYLQATKYDKEAYGLLFDWFLNEGVIVILSVAKHSKIEQFNLEDLKLLLSDMFIGIIRGFNIAVSPFKTYATFLLKKRALRIIEESISFSNKFVCSIDAPNKEGISILDVAESEDYASMQNELYKSSNSYFLSSTNFKSKKIDKRLTKLLDYQEKGFKKKEIMRIMNLTDGQYRYLLRVLYDIEHGNIKIALK